MKTIIVCPKCGWVHDGQAHWQCHVFCLHVWNTFSTAGICPACSFKWEQTQCPQCEAWSNHLDWYITLDEPDEMNEQDELKEERQSKDLITEHNKKS
jgi:hypothetical protein